MAVTWCRIESRLESGRSPAEPLAVCGGTCPGASLASRLVVVGSGA